MFLSTSIKVIVARNKSSARGGISYLIPIEAFGALLLGETLQSYKSRI